MKDGPINRSRRWMVIRRRPGAAARFNHPTTLTNARYEASLPLYDDEKVGVYELVEVGLVEAAQHVAAEAHLGEVTDGSLALLNDLLEES